MQSTIPDRPYIPPYQARDAFHEAALDYMQATVEVGVSLDMQLLQEALIQIFAAGEDPSRGRISDVMQRISYDREQQQL
jgi:hypothetical protein